jgi:hypothetical protein
VKIAASLEKLKSSVGIKKIAKKGRQYCPLVAGNIVGLGWKRIKDDGKNTNLKTISEKNEIQPGRNRLPFL